MNLKQLMNATNVETMVVVKDQAGKVVFDWAAPLEVEAWATANMTVMAVTPIFARDDTPIPVPALEVKIEERDAPEEDPVRLQLAAAMAVMKKERDQLAEQLKEATRSNTFRAILAEFSEDYVDDVRAAIMARADGWEQDATAAALFRAWKAATERARRDLTFAAGNYAAGGDGADEVRLARYNYDEARTLRTAIYTVLISPAMAAVKKGGGGK